MKVLMERGAVSQEEETPYVMSLSDHNRNGFQFIRIFFVDRTENRHYAPDLLKVQLNVTRDARFRE